MPESTAFPARTVGVRATAKSVRSGRALTQANPAGNWSTGTAAVWSRIQVVLVALLAIKMVLIAGQGQGLYEAHWRIGGTNVTWVNVGAFVGFVLLGVLGLVELGRESQTVGVRSVRFVNAVVLVLGLCFIFLTFHNGNKNYLYPILNGILKWDSLGPYLTNSLFFNPPFLAAWVFAYASLYYILARTGRERRVLSLTAAFACAYALLQLRDLIAYRDELLILDTLGLISLLATWHRNQLLRDPGPPNQAGSASVFSRDWLTRFGWAWLLLPLVWTVFFCWALLRFDSLWHTSPAEYFLGLAAFTAALFTVATLVVRKLGRTQNWMRLVLFFSVAFFLFCDTNYSSSENYQHLLCLALTFPRYFAGELALLGLLALAGVFCRRRWPKASLWWLDAAALALVLLAVFDLRLSQIMGVRLGWDLLSFGDSPKMMLRLAKPYLPALIIGFLAIVFLYWLALRGLRCLTPPGSRMGEAPRNDSFNFIPLRVSTPAFYIGAIFVCFGVLGMALADSDKARGEPALRLVQTSPWWKRLARRTLSRDDFIKSAKALGLGDLSLAPGVSPAQPPRDLNVLVVFMESSYNKHLSLFGSSEETQPVLSKYKDRMELFPNFFSAFAGSIHARFATFTSLYPVQDFHAFTQERVPVKSLFEVLHDRGYTCSMFYSSSFDYTGFRDFLKNRGLDEMYDADTMPGQRTTERVEWGLLEAETLGAIRAQLQKYAQSQQRFCLTYVPAAPHYPYDKIPKAFQKNKMEQMGDFTPVYLNELLYMDWVIGSIVEQLKESGLLDNTLVVITNDHGEMLGGKDGHIGHGWAITPVLANTPLILMDPQRTGYQINYTPGTQVDILPTILDRLHIPVPADQLYEGLSLDAGTARAGRLGYLNSYQQFAVLSGDLVLLGDREGAGPAGVSSASVYTLSNQGPTTIFTESQPDPLPERKAAMARFDAFQDSLLRNYDFYRASIRGTGQQTKSSGKELTANLR